MTKLTGLNKASANRTAEVYGVQDEQDASLNARDISEVSAIPAAMSRSKKLSIGFVGDSIGSGFGNYSLETSPLMNAVAKYYNADVIWDDRNFENGGMRYARAGWTSTQILDVQLDQVIERTPDILIINGGTNDGHVNLDAAYNNMTTLIQGCLDAGVQHIFFLPLLPRIHVTNMAQNYINFNNRIYDYIQKITRVTFIDCCDALVDVSASDTFNPIGGNTNDDGAVTTGGLHLSAIGSDLIAKRFVEHLKKIVPERPRRVVYKDSGSSSVQPHSDLWGGVGAMVAGGGTLNGDASAVVPSGFVLNTDPALNVICNYVMNPELNRYVLRVELSGTASQLRALEMTQAHNSSSIYTRGSGFICQTDVEYKQNIGVTVPLLQIQIAGPAGDTVAISGGSTLSNRASVDLYRLETPRPVIVPLEGDYHTRSLYRLEIRSVVGREVDAVVEISNVGLFRTVVPE